MRNLYEKTDVLVGKLDVDKVGGNIKVRLGKNEETPDFLFYAQDRKLLESIVRGTQNISGRTPAIYKVNYTDYHQIIFGHNFTKELCDKLHINFDAIKNELKQSHATVDNLHLEPARLKR